MNKLDLCGKTDHSHYLYTEIEKIRTSMEHRQDALFVLIKEIEDQLLLMQERFKQGKF